MKRVEIIFDEAVENEILMILRQAQAEHWTRFDNIRGHGTSGAKLNNSVGPGINSVLVVYTDEEKAFRIVESIKRFKQVAEENEGHAGTHCIISTVEQFV